MRRLINIVTEGAGILREGAGTTLVEGEGSDGLFRAKALNIWESAKAQIIKSIVKRHRRFNGRPIPVFTMLLGGGAPGTYYDDPVVWTGDNGETLTVHFESTKATAGAELRNSPGSKDALVVLFHRLTEQPSETILYDEKAVTEYLDNTYKSKFFHEVIHYLDLLRYSHDRHITAHMEMLHRIRRHVSPFEYSRTYLNSPHESNAHYHQIVLEYLISIENGHVPEPESFKEMVAQIRAVVLPNKAPVAKVFDNLLSTDNQRSWLKRWASLYTQRFAGGAASQIEGSVT